MSGLKKYFAVLDSKQHGITKQVRFESLSISKAKAFANLQALLNFKRNVSGAENDSTYKVESYSPTKHDKFFEASDQTGEWKRILK